MASKTARFRAAIKRKQRKRRERTSRQKRVKGNPNRHPRKKK